MGWVDRGVPPPKGPIPMLPVAQLYARDVTNLPVPDGTDLLQVLWCPFEHDDDPEYVGMPKTTLFWRSAAAVTDILQNPPEPAAVESSDYVPEPCVIDPEQIVEYPTQAEKWTAGQIAGTEPDDYDDDDPYDGLYIAPGWKVGGWIDWVMTDPYPQPCPACGTPTEPLLTIATEEWSPHVPHWIPLELNPTGIVQLVDRDSMHPTQVDIRGGYRQIIRVCPISADHPHRALMQ